MRPGAGSSSGWSPTPGCTASPSSRCRRSTRRKPALAVAPWSRRRSARGRMCVTAAASSWIGTRTPPATSWPSRWCSGSRARATATVPPGRRELARDDRVNAWGQSASTPGGASHLGRAGCRNQESPGVSRAECQYILWMRGVWKRVVIHVAVGSKLAVTAQLGGGNVSSKRKAARRRQAQSGKLAVMPGPRNGQQQGEPSEPAGPRGAPRSQRANGWVDTPALAAAARVPDEAAQVAVAFAEPSTLPVLGRRRRRSFGRRLLWHKGFHWSERNWRKSAWRRQLGLVPMVVAGLVLVGIASTVAIVIAYKASSQVANRPPTVQATAPLSSGIVLQQTPAAGTPTPQAAQNLMGVWVPNPSPPTSAPPPLFSLPPPAPHPPPHAPA